SAWPTATVYSRGAARRRWPSTRRLCCSTPSGGTRWPRPDATLCAGASIGRPLPLDSTPSGKRPSPSPTALGAVADRNASVVRRLGLELSDLLLGGGGLRGAVRAPLLVDLVDVRPTHAVGETGAAIGLGVLQPHPERGADVSKDLGVRLQVRRRDVVVERHLR